MNRGILSSKNSIKTQLISTPTKQNTKQIIKDKDDMEIDIPVMNFLKNAEITEDNIKDKLNITKIVKFFEEYNNKNI